MSRAWLLGASLVMISLFLLPLPYGYSETELVPTQAALPAARIHPAAVVPSAVSMVLPVRSAHPAAVQVIEPSRRVALEQLRRSLSRYPDHDMAGRFFEQATEQLPLFGEDD